MLKDLLLKTRSYRKFKQNILLSDEVLKSFVDLTRYTPSGENLQGIKYKISCDPERNKEIFQCLGWAGYLKDWNGPEEGQQPAGYVIAVEDTSLGQVLPADYGLTALAMLLGAQEQGYGGCMLASIDKKRLAKVLELDGKFEIQYVLAFGVADEEIVLEPMSEEGDYKYWRDETQVHHVPKRSLEEILI